jgi:hypothetical protein
VQQAVLTPRASRCPRGGDWGRPPDPRPFRFPLAFSACPLGPRCLFPSYGPRRRRRGCRLRRNPRLGAKEVEALERAPQTPALGHLDALTQPENRGAGRCASEAVGRRIGMLRQPKLPGGASRCATGRHRMRVVMLREFRVSDRLLSYRLGGAFCHFDRAVPLYPYGRALPLCPYDRALPLVISTERERVEKSAGRSAKQAHGRGHSVRCADGCGAPGADFGLWRTAVGQPGTPGGCRCAAVWRVWGNGVIVWREMGNCGRDSRPKPGMTWDNASAQAGNDGGMLRPRPGMTGERLGKLGIVGEIPGQAGSDGGNACGPSRE